MKPGRIEITHNFTGETDYVIITWRKTSAPLVEIGREVYPAAHSQQSLLIEDLDPVMHFVSAYRSADGVALDMQINILACDAKNGAIYPITRYEYIVDRGNGSVTPGEAWSDPVSDSIELRDERLKDKEYWVEERNTGTFLMEELTDRSDLGGGFDLNIPDKVFFTDAVYIAFVISKVDINPGEVGSSDYSDIVLLEDDQDFVPATMMGKVLIAKWVTTIGTLTIPNLSLIPDGKFKLQAHDGTQRNVVIQFDAGDTIRFHAEDMNAIILGKGEFIEILFKDNQAYVISSDTNHSRVGRRMLADLLEINSLYLDGTQYNQADVPRLMWFVDKLPANQIVTELQWGTVQVVDGDNVYPDKGKFARDDVGGTIRVPDDRNMFYRALKYVDGITADGERVTNFPGGYQHDQFHSHKHTASGDWNWFGTSGHGNLSSNNDAVRQEAWNRTQDALNVSGGTETRGLNRGLLPIIII